MIAALYLILAAAGLLLAGLMLLLARDAVWRRSRRGREGWLR